MKILVDDSEYDVSDILNKVSIGNLDILQMATADRESDYKGTTRSTLKKYLNTTLPDLIKTNPEMEQDELFGDVEFRRVMVGLVFLARRFAGGEQTVEDAKAVLITDFKILPAEPGEGGDSPKDAADETLPTPSS